ncbi:MAG: YvcK family protein, partial [Candidatus Omnitrophica bacterium]|nr:YvcK family protein [Candidatus Omnitrophota bacterium]
MAKIRERLAGINPEIWDEFEIDIRGITSIDIRKRYAGKEYALTDYLRKNNIDRGDVLFFGNLNSYSEDQAFFSKVTNINRFANSETEDRHFIKLDIGLGSIYFWLELVLRHPDKENNALIEIYSQYKAQYPPLQAALDYLREEMQGAYWKRMTHRERITVVSEIYKRFNLTYVDAPSWAYLYKVAFPDGDILTKALSEFIEAYDKYDNTRALFEAADRIYNSTTGLNFFDFYEAIDARVAHNIVTFSEMYLRMGKSKEDLKKNVISYYYYSADKEGYGIARILAGLYQDDHFLRYKKSILRQMQTRAPPKIVYLGGGGKATTTLLQKFVAKGIEKLACIISSSDDGGSSWKIMQSLFAKLGFYFIPPGDAAGLNIFLSNDNFKIFTLFWMESLSDKLPAYLSTKGRISADRIYPIWKQRIFEVLKALNNPSDKQEIEKSIKEKINISEDFILFFASLLSLGDLLDRELISTDIIKLDGASTANLLLIGDAYDIGVIGVDKQAEDIEGQPLLERLLNLGNRQPIAVSYDYERSALIGEYEDGTKVLTQTIITDKAHKQLIKKLYFSHRATIQTQKQTEAGDINYPDANLRAVEELDRAEIIVMGNGSLWTSLMPVLLYSEIAKILIEKRAEGVPVVFIAKIKADLETSAGVDIEEKDGKYYLTVEKQLNLKDQLEAIRTHVSRVVERAVRLNEIFSHIIIPQLSRESIEKLNIVEIKKDSAKKLKASLEKGEAQISKYVEGIQPPVTEEIIGGIESQGIEVIKVAEDKIKGIDEKKPMYDNEYLY